jgi:hypothetical protein
MKDTPDTSLTCTVQLHMGPPRSLQGRHYQWCSYSHLDSQCTWSLRCKPTLVMMNHRRRASDPSLPRYYIATIVDSKCN